MGKLPGWNTGGRVITITQYTHFNMWGLKSLISKCGHTVVKIVNNGEIGVCKMDTSADNSFKK